MLKIHGSWRAYTLNTYVFSLAIAIQGFALAAPDQPTYPSNEELRHLKKISDPELSPDNTQVLVRIADGPADGAKGHLWLIPVNSGLPRQLTFSVSTDKADKSGEGSGQWMPNGQSIVFLAHRGEHDGLFILPMNGGEARALSIKVHPQVDASKYANALPTPKDGTTSIPNATATDGIEDLEVDVKEFAISADSRVIAFSAKDPETPGEKKQMESKADAKWVDHDDHGTRLYLLDTLTEKVTSVAVPVDVQEFQWTGDGSKLLVVTAEPHSAEDLGPARKAWLINRSDPLNPHQLAALPPTIESAAWSLDGKTLWYLAQAGRDAPPGDVDLYRYNFATQISRNVSDGQPWSLRSTPPLALADGSVVVSTQRGLDMPVMRYKTDGAEPSALRLPQVAITASVTNATRGAWVFLGSSGGQLPQLYYSKDLDSVPKKLPIPPLGTEKLRSTQPKRIEWRSEGRTIQGLLYLPPAAAKARVPLVLEVHGGPLGQYSDGYSPFDDFLLGQGWAVLKSNPRGSSGRGTAFAAANKNALGGGDYRDIMTGVDYAIRTEAIDAHRLALIGYSYGGEMAGFVEGKTLRFKAIVSGAPVVDQYSEYGTEESSWFDRWYLGKPWEHPADAWRQSPLAGVGHGHTPFLILQGETDVTDPLGQSQEMYRALRQLHVPVELIVYPRGGHGPLANAIFGNPVPEPWHGFDARRRIVEFIGKAFEGR